MNWFWYLLLLAAIFVTAMIRAKQIEEENDNGD